MLLSRREVRKSTGGERRRIWKQVWWVRAPEPFTSPISHWFGNKESKLTSSSRQYEYRWENGLGQSQQVSELLLRTKSQKKHLWQLVYS
jgi:hypothetical protein